MNIRSLAYGMCGPALLAGLLLVSLLSGCRQSPDPFLLAADSIMERHPDSALMLLSDYHLSMEASTADSAYYALLLTQARYKNFIDETDDSLISVAADYFLNHGDNEKASRALFLKGMIQMNANRLGDAAVSFRKGLDIARDSKCYMWEGQCARGLCMLYGELYDGSAQIDYGRQALDAFQKGNYKKWILSSKLMLARAYNNNCQYEEALSRLNELDLDYAARINKFLLSEIFQLKGISFFGLGRYGDCMASYHQAHNIDPSVLTDNDIKILEIASNELPIDSSVNCMEWCETLRGKNETYTSNFAVLANHGDYKAAYESLENYKNMQDSVLSLIFKNNVYESINQYNAMQARLLQQSMTNERMSYMVLFLIFILISIVVLWRLRERAHREESLRLKLEADLDIVRADLLLQVENAKNIQKKASTDSGRVKTDGFEEIIKQRYAEANRLCDDYYQGRYTKNDKEQLDEKIKSILRSFSNRSGLEEIGKYVDEKSGGLYSSFKQVFFNFTEEDYRLFLYLILGFTPRTISILTGHKITVLYNKKSRLKSKIEKSNHVEKDVFLRFF